LLASKISHHEHKDFFMPPSINSMIPNQASPPAPAPSSAPTIGSDTTKILAEGGQVFSQGLGVKPVTEPPAGTDGGPGNVASDDSPLPGQVNKTTGNTPRAPGPQTHSVWAGVIKNQPLPGFGGGAPRGKGKGR
jgi:hypothetical protein